MSLFAFCSAIAGLGVAFYTLSKQYAENLRLEQELRKMTVDLINKNNIELSNAVQGNVIDLVQNLHDQGGAGKAATKGLQEFNFNAL